jgi:hypothetical protein
MSGFDVAAARAARQQGSAPARPGQEHRGVESTHVPPDGDQRFTVRRQLPAGGGTAEDVELALPV